MNDRRVIFHSSENKQGKFLPFLVKSGISQLVSINHQGLAVMFDVTKGGEDHIRNIPFNLRDISLC